MMGATRVANACCRDRPASSKGLGVAEGPELIERDESVPISALPSLQAPQVASAYRREAAGTEPQAIFWRYRQRAASSMEMASSVDAARVGGNDESARKNQNIRQKSPAA